MWKFASQFASVSRKLLINSKQTRSQKYSLFMSKTPNVKIRTYIPIFSGFAIGYGLVRVMSNVTCSKNETENPLQNKKWTLYQYATCPFCNKVQVFLDYYGIEYDIVEVNPLFRKEIKFSDYRKVPILKNDHHQLNDSSLIISILKSQILGNGDIDTLLTYYPTIATKNGSKNTIEYQNKYNVMYQRGFDANTNMKLKEEVKWRQWVDDTFVHTLSPNIYRTLSESLKAMEYITNVGNFTSFERTLVYYSGALAMYVIGKRVKKRHNLKNDVRESMYSEARLWTKAVGKKRNFLGGKSPSLADLNMFGVIRAIEGLDAFDDLMKNTEIEPWYRRMKAEVESHAGTKRKDWLLGSCK